MNRSQRRAARKSRMVEVCLNGCCPPADGDLAGGVLRPMFVRITDDGDAVLACPWCDSDVPGNLVPGDTWDCPSCKATGLLGGVMS